MGELAIDPMPGGGTGSMRVRPAALGADNIPEGGAEGQRRSPQPTAGGGCSADGLPHAGGRHRAQACSWRPQRNGRPTPAAGSGRMPGVGEWAKPTGPPGGRRWMQCRWATPRPAVDTGFRRFLAPAAKRRPTPAVGSGRMPGVGGWAQPTGPPGGRRWMQRRWATPCRRQTPGSGVFWRLQREPTPWLRARAGGREAGAPRGCGACGSPPPCPTFDGAPSPLPHPRGRA